MHGPKDTREDRWRRPVPRRKPRDSEDERPERLRVLIAEDQAITALNMEAFLNHAGIDVVGIAASAADAVHLARTKKPDLIVMDVGLQGKVDGIDAARHIFETTGVRCIFVSAALDPEARARAKGAQPLGWVSKPHPFTSLLRLIQAATPALRRRKTAGPARRRGGKGDCIDNKYTPRIRGRR